MGGDHHHAVGAAAALHFGGDAVQQPLLGGGQTLEHLAETAGVGPLGHHGGHGGGGGVVGVLVAGDVDAAGAGLVDHVQQLLGLAPQALGHDLQVGDVQVGAGMLGDVQHLLHGFKHPGTLVADVDGQDGIVLFQHTGQALQLLGLGEGAGGIDQAQGHAEGALGQFLIQPLLQGRLLLRRGGTVVEAHNGAAQGAVAGQDAVVGAGTVGLDGGGIVGGVQQGDLQTVGGELEVSEEVVVQRRAALGRGGQNGDAAVAAKLKGDALLQLGLHIELHQRADIGVGVDVQKAGGDDFAGGVHHLLGLGLDVRRDGGDAAVLDAHVRLVGRGTGTVNHGSVSDDEIIHGKLPPL